MLIALSVSSFSRSWHLNASPTGLHIAGPLASKQVRTESSCQWLPHMLESRDFAARHDAEQPRGAVLISAYAGSLYLACVLPLSSYWCWPLMYLRLRHQPISAGRQPECVPYWCAKGMEATPPGSSSSSSSHVQLLQAHLHIRQQILSMLKQGLKHDVIDPASFQHATADMYTVGV